MIGAHDRANLEPLPPQNPEAEEAVLGALLLAGTTGAGAATLTAVRSTGLDRVDFYRDSHRLIYAACVALVEQNIDPEPIAVAALLEREKTLDRVGGKKRIHELAALVPAIGNAPHYAALVVDASRRRDEHAVGKALQTSSSNGGLQASPELRERLTRLLSDRTAADERTRAVDGWTFLHSDAYALVPVWGADERVLWARGEPLMLIGPDGVGKTSVAQQLVLARLRGGTLLGFPVAPTDAKVLYIAADRPAQAARSMRRMVTADDEDVLRERLVFWRGPLPFDLLREPPATLRQFVESHGATDLVVDSLKDVCKKLAEDEGGLAVSQALQEVVAAGIEALVLHHQRKPQQGAAPPKTIADVYGSRWLTASMGSVALLWGEPGDLVVDFKHLKQPAEDVGPFNVLHDHAHGRTTVYESADLEQILAAATHGLLVRDAARLLYGKEDPGRNEIEKTRRRLEAFIGNGRAGRDDDPDGAARYFPREAA